MEYIYHYSSPLGGMTMTERNGALSGLWFDDQPYFADTLGKEHEERKLPVFEETVDWLDTYFSGRQPDVTPPLRLNGTGFQMRAWEILLTIPYGGVMTYGEIAKILAEERGIPRMAAQAVGGAAARNPILIIVPCHRVVGANGALTGFGAGLDRKRRLLELEGAAWRMRR